MFTLNKLTTLIAAVLFASSVNCTIITTIEDVTNGGGFFAEVTFSNNGTNTVKVTADISDPINLGLSQGDILGMWFDLSDVSLLNGNLVFGGATPVLDFEYGENSVSSSLGRNVNLNGSGASNWDLAVNVGTNGSSGGFVQTLSFDMTIPGLSQLLFAEQRVGMRVQSIEGTNFNSGSSKLLGTGLDIEPVNLLPTDLPLTTITEVAEPQLLLLYAVGLLGIGLKIRRRSVGKTNV